MTLPVGLHLDVPEAEYHADPCLEPSLSRSLAHTLLTRSPRHAWYQHPRLNPGWQPDEPTPQSELGTALHQMLLEPAPHRICVVDAKDWRTKAAQEQREAARADGWVPLLAETYQDALTIVGAARNQLAETELACVNDGGDGEATAVWQDGAAWLRSRLDWVSADRRLIVDYKTTSTSAEPNAFLRRILSEGYDLQACMTRRAILATCGVEAQFVFFVQEVEPPYMISLLALNPEWMAFASYRLHRAIERWQECRRSNQWPAYPSRVVWLDLPPWAEAQFTAAELEER